jgi:hypothetical protein
LQKTSSAESSDAKPEPEVAYVTLKPDEKWCDDTDQS